MIIYYRKRTVRTYDYDTHLCTDVYLEFCRAVGNRGEA